MRTRYTARLLIVCVAGLLAACSAVAPEDGGAGDGSPARDVAQGDGSADSAARDVVAPPLDVPATDVGSSTDVPRIDVPGSRDVPMTADVPRTGVDVRMTDTGPEAAVCGAGQIACGIPSTCVNAQSDPRHCGRCNNACPTTQMCSAGVCVAVCSSPSVICTTPGGNACVNTQTDVTHCGRCNNACPSGQTCRLGACQPTTGCPAGQTMCGTRCVALQTDATNCGACGRVCTDGRGCSGGTCNWNDVLVRVNAARAAPRTCGTRAFPATTPLTADARLDAASLTHSRDMTARNFFSHTGSDGSTVGVRVTRAGYSWSAVGENIAAGQRTTQSVVDGWLASPGHCANIMSANFRHMGIAAVSCSTCMYPIYWTQDFGRP